MYELLLQLFGEKKLLSIGFTFGTITSLLTLLLFLLVIYLYKCSSKIVGLSRQFIKKLLHTWMVKRSLPRLTKMTSTLTSLLILDPVLA